MKWLLRLVAIGSLFSCGPNTDLTVAPPKTPTKISVDVPAPLDTGRLPTWERPHHYTLALDIDPSAPRFSGEVEIDVAIDKPTAAFVLHAAGLRIHQANVVAGGKTHPAQAQLRSSAGAPPEHDEELVLTIASEVEAGDVQLQIQYSGPLTESLRGVYRVRDGGADFVFTQFEPSDARRLFPCFDDPIYKTTFDVSIAAPKDDAVFANTPLKSEQAKGDRVVHTFATSKPMPTYLVALAVGPLEVQQGATEPVPIRLIAARGKAALGSMALQAAAEQLAILVEYFGSPYPYAKLDLVAVPNFAAGAMENVGLMTFREELLLVDAATASAKQRRGMVMTMAHELAHQWFGNLVTMNWWDDLWLNEGFSTYAETLIIDRHQPQMRADLDLLSWAGWVMDFDALESARAVRQPVQHTYQAEEAFDGITYVKGASVINMLHQWIGDEAFQKGLRAYMNEHAWGNATGDDMFRALSAASGKAVGPAAMTFLDQPGVPLVRADVSCEKGKAPRVALSQERYSGRAKARGAGGALWRIPVCVSWAGKRRNAKIERTCMLLEERTAQLELPTKTCPGWLLPNADYAGYYRYALPKDDLAKLAKASRGLDTRHQVGMLTNLWALVQAGDASGRDLLEILPSYAKAKDRAIIDEVVGILSHVSGALIEDAARPEFERLVSALLMPIANKLGWDGRSSDSEDDRLMRRNVLTSLGVLTSEPWMKRQAGERANKWLADPTSVDADTATIALRVAARQSSVTFDRLAAALREAKTPAERIALVQALGSLGEASELRRTFGLILDGTIRAQDALYVARTASEWPDSRALFIDWLEDNLEPMARKAPGFGAARMMSPVRRLCDAAARNAASNSFEPVAAKLPSLPRRLREALETADLCIDLRSREAKAVTSYLKSRKRF